MSSWILSFKQPKLFLPDLSCLFLWPVFDSPLSLLDWWLHFEFAIVAVYQSSKKKLVVFDRLQAKQMLANGLLACHTEEGNLCKSEKGNGLWLKMKLLKVGSSDYIIAKHSFWFRPDFKSQLF